MDSPDGAMEAVKRERSEIQVKEKKIDQEEEEKAAGAEARKAFLARQEEIWAELDRDDSSDTDEEHEEPWASYRDWWNRVWGADSLFGTFETITNIPPMCLTYEDYDVGHARETLLFFSIKVLVHESLELPLDAYGLFAVRDIIDHKHNMIFYRLRDNCQTIISQDPYLELTGPTRAVFFLRGTRAVAVTSNHYSCFEAKLKVKGATESEDEDLSLLARTYRSGFGIRRFTSKLSTLEMNFHEIRCSVEATISVKVIEGSWPDSFRGVLAASIDSIDGMEVNLLEIGDGKLHVDADGKIKLRRSVVSVELEGKLKVSVRAYRVNEEHVADTGEADFTPKEFDTSSGYVDLNLASCRMEITVGWSLFHFHPGEGGGAITADI